MPFGLGALKGVGNAVMNAPGMGAIKKPLAKGMQKTPGLGAIGKGIGLGPSQPPQQGGGMQNAVQNVGNAVGQAFNRPRPEPMQPIGQMQPGYARPQLQPMMGRGPEQNPWMKGGGNFQRPQPYPEAPLPPPVMNQGPPPPDEQNTPEMMDMKQQQIAAMGQSMGGMFGGGMARPQRMMGGGMGPMAMPDSPMDAMRRNKFQQMRQGGIGPRFGMQQQQQEPEQY